VEVDFRTGAPGGDKFLPPWDGLAFLEGQANQLLVGTSSLRGLGRKAVALYPEGEPT